MNKLSILAVSWLTLASANLAEAATIYITGSSAFRSSALAAIKNSFDSGVVFGYVGTSASGANQSIYVGTVGGVATTVKTFWSGSEAGILTVANPVSTTRLKFLPDNPTIGGNAATLTNAGVASLDNPTTGTNANDLANADIAFSDTLQSTSAFKTGVYQTLVESPNSPVGVIPFKWVASKGAPVAVGTLGKPLAATAAAAAADPTNLYYPGLSAITSQQARGLFANGKLPLALFTGSNSDQTKFVYAIGRDPDSGTRLSAFAECGLGALATVKQYQPRDSNGTTITTINSTVTTAVPWPAGLVNGNNVSTFNGGYDSGGKVVGALGSDTSGMVISGVTGGNFISYLGTPDAATAIAAGAVELAFNGVKLGSFADYNLATALTEGLYTFWSFEHVYYRTNATGTIVKTFADALSNEIKNNTATVKLSSMKVTRTGDGTTVKQNY